MFDYDPQNRNGQELAFHKGDFFHVLSREEDTEWYEACNPLIPTARGLVPVAYFETIGKQQRQSGQSIGSNENLPHDSGFAEKGTTNSNHTQSHSQMTAKMPGTPGHQRGLSMAGKNAGAMVYGVVQYDFNAERADELDARAGEAIIVVAQSNPEWFVAKPIGRLGGPGLIPVAFVDIKDTTTMQSVHDPLAAVQKAGVPKVEEWKKFAAEYKNSSISLGKFDGGAAQQMAEGMGRMSLQQQQGQQRQNQYVGTNVHVQDHTDDRQPQAMSQHPNQSQGMPMAPVQASVPRYCFDNDMYWYIIECQMEDGRWFELSRYYADFYDFQIALLESFPEEAGNKGKARSLPFMPGPVAHVTDAISNGRRQNLDEYIKKIIGMPPHISKSVLVRNLFKPKPGQDFEIDPNALHEDYRLSGASQQSLQRIQSNQTGHSGPPQNTPPSGYGGMGPSPGSRTSAQQSRQPPNPNMPPNGASPYSNRDLHNQPSTLTQNTSSSNPHPSQRTAQPGGAMKIKVFFQDDIIAIRVPSDITFVALKEKLIERLKVNEDIVMQYKDERSGEYVDLRDERGLDEGLARNEKLVVLVNYAAG